MANVDPSGTDDTLIFDAVILAAASMTALAMMQVLMSSSSALSAALLAAPKQQANVHTTELAVTAKTIDVILGNGGSAPSGAPSNKGTKKILRLLRRLVNENAGAPVVT